MLKNKKKSLHIGLWILGILVVAITVFSVWVSSHYKAIIKQQLPAIIAKNTDSLYRITLGDISINVLTRNVTLRNVRLTHDSTRGAAMKQANRLPATLLTITIPELRIAGIQWENLASNSAFDCAYIIINKPTVLVDGAPKPLDSLVDDVVDKKKVIETLSAGKISVLDPTLTYHFVDDSNDYKLGVKGGKIMLTDWKFEPGKGMDTSTFFFAKNSDIQLDSFSYSKKGNMYGIGSSGVAFSTGNRNLTLKNVFIRLTGSRDDFYKKIGYQKEIYDMSFPTVEIAGLNWKDLIAGKQLSADTMNITNPSMDLYFSRTYPASTMSKMGNYPHQLLRKLKLKIDVKKLLVSNGSFKYTELNDKTRKEGIITFNRVSGTINNLTNMDNLIAANDKCYIKLKGKYMNRADVSATFMLLLSDPKGYFTVDGTASNVNAADVNQPARNLGLIDVEEFHVSQFGLHVEGNENYGKGKYTMLYDVLKINFLKMNEDNKTDKKGLGVASTLANALALFPANPMPGKEARVGETYITRNPQKGFFNLIWKNVFDGANNIALRSPELVANVKQAVKDQKKGKGGFLRKIFKKKDKK